MYEKLTTTSAIEYFENPAALAHNSDQLPRFVLPTDETIVADYQFVRSRLDQVMEADGAIVGATAFGSTTKGYADVSRSDIDVTVFVDADKLGLSLNDDLSSASVSLSTWHGFKNAWHADERYDQAMKKLFHPSTTEAAHLPVHVDTLAISHTLVHKLAEFEIKNAKRAARYWQLREAGEQQTEIDSLADWSTVSTDEAVLQSIPGLVERMTEDEKKHGIHLLAVRQFLARIAVEENTEFARLRTMMFCDNRLASSLPLRLFNLALTPGLQPYRRAFLGGLTQADNPEGAYTFFKQRLIAFEDSQKNPRDTARLAYPETLAEALTVYG